MSIRDQDIMVLHRTIPNPMVIPDPAITAVPRHTIPSPMVIRDPVDKMVASHFTTKTSMVQTTRGGRWMNSDSAQGIDTLGSAFWGTLLGL